MSLWVRAVTPTVCGKCGERIDRGSRMRLMTLAKLKRCEACAGEPAPELPELAERRVSEDRRQPTTDRRVGDRRGTTERLGQLSIAARASKWIVDGKAKQSGADR